MTLDDLVAARAARQKRWGSTFDQPRSAADEIDHLRWRLDAEIDAAQQTVIQAESHLHTAQARLTGLLTRRDEHDALEAEVAALRASTAHAQYVVREPVVIIPRERPALRTSFPGAIA